MKGYFKQIMSLVLTVCIAVTLIGVNTHSFAAEDGDINGDGIVDSSDVILLLKNIYMPDYYPIDVDGDLDADGSVTSDDCSLLLKYAFDDGHKNYRLYGTTAEPTEEPVATPTPEPEAQKIVINASDCVSWYTNDSSGNITLTTAGAKVTGMGGGSSQAVWANAEFENYIFASEYKYGVVILKADAVGFGAVYSEVNSGDNLSGDFYIEGNGEYEAVCFELTGSLAEPSIPTWGELTYVIINRFVFFTTEEERAAYIAAGISAHEESTEISAEDEEVGLDVTDKTDLVGICYTMWFDAYLGTGTSDVSDYQYNVSELLESWNFNNVNGFYTTTTTKKRGKTTTTTTTNNSLYTFYYWAKPAQGYYRSTDKTAHRNNLELIGAADVDYLILDFTYASGSGWCHGTNAWSTYIYNPCVALLDTIVEMRAEGEKVPYVVFWVNDSTMFSDIYTYFYSKAKWKDCFVYWNDKPFVLTWQYKSEYATNETFTVKSMYGLQSSGDDNQWSYLEHDNTTAASSTHMACAVAAQSTYMSYTDTAYGRQSGKFWYNQWKNAFEAHPKFITVTWWNEWGAQLYDIDGYGWAFTDNYNQEYSRDIEPMEGGHGDQYYQWLCSYVAAYKAHEECPENYN